MSSGRWRRREAVVWCALALPLLLPSTASASVRPGFDTAAVTTSGALLATDQDFSRLRAVYDGSSGQGVWEWGCAPGYTSTWVQEPASPGVPSPNQTCPAGSTASYLALLDGSRTRFMWIYDANDTDAPPAPSPSPAGAPSLSPSPSPSPSPSSSPAPSSPAPAASPAAQPSPSMEPCPSESFSDTSTVCVYVLGGASTVSLTLTHLFGLMLLPSVLVALATGSFVLRHGRALRV